VDHGIFFKNRKQDCLSHYLLAMIDNVPGYHRPLSPLRNLRG